MDKIRSEYAAHQTMRAGAVSLGIWQGDTASFAQPSPRARYIRQRRAMARESFFARIARAIVNAK